MIGNGVDEFAEPELMHDIHTKYTRIAADSTITQPMYSYSQGRVQPMYEYKVHDNTTHHTVRTQYARRAAAWRTELGRTLMNPQILHLSI